MTPFRGYLDEFPSLHQCLWYVQSHYSQDAATVILVRDLDTGEVKERSTATYLYRGEGRAFPSTLSSMDRLLRDSDIAEDTKSTVHQVVGILEKQVGEFLGLDPLRTRGFMQHYGAPTEFLDLTSDLDVAGFFACGADAGSQGFLCVLPLSDAVQHATIVDLTNHPMAERPRRQSAYALTSAKYPDLKDRLCTKALNLKWFAFTLQQSDVDHYRGNYAHVLDATTDQFAGVLQLIMADVPKFADPAAKWLSERLVAAPFVTVAATSYNSPDLPKTLLLKSADESGYGYDEQDERLRNYTMWSEKFPETEPHRVIRRLHSLLEALGSEERVLYRLGPDWPAGRNVDVLMTGRGLAFVYDPDTSSGSSFVKINTRRPDAERWCAEHGIRLIVISDPSMVTEPYLRKALRSEHSQ
jgi:hypothetical protein